MASNYPAGLDTFDTIDADDRMSDQVGGRRHRDMHNGVNDAVEAVQAELGVDPAGSAATVAARLDGIEDGTRLGAGSVGAAQLADNAVDTAAIQAKAVTAAKIADDTITATQIAANAVGASELADNAVDTAAIADSAVTSAKIADGTIVDADISAAAAIAATKISGTALVASTVDAKGDLYVGTAADTVARLAVGSNGALLVADSAQTAGVRWTTARRLEGTGAPEGAVTAPPGSTFLQTDSTVDVKGWIRWVKASGTGNTGWVAGPEADTGWRNIDYTDSGASGQWTTGTVRIRRRGIHVSVIVFNVGMSALGGSNFIYSLPTGFKNTTPGSEPLGGVVREAGITGYPVWLNISVEKVGFQGQALTGTFSASTWRFSGVFPSFITADAWPASLPGSAA